MSQITPAHVAGTTMRSSAGRVLLAALVGASALGVATATSALGVVAPAAASSPGAGWSAYVVNSVSDDVTPIDVASGTAGAPIPVGNAPVAIAITPDASTAYVANGDSDDVTPIDVATGTAGTPIPAGDSPAAVAITPDGTTAYVVNAGSNDVTPIDVATNAPGGTIEVGAAPQGVAITPDGATAYVVNDLSNDISPIDVATGTAGTPIPVGDRPYAIALTPDGTTAYVVNAFFPGAVTPVDLATGTAGTPIAAGDFPVAVAITPDGTTAYVTDVVSNSVTPIDVATDTAGTPIPVDLPFAVAFTPDGATAYVADALSEAVTPIDVATSTAGTPIPVGEGPFAIAITPDQAPAAAVTVDPAPPGSASTFDASGSTVRFGTIASYAWDFGDGTTASTATATTTHVYADPGTYIATVTATSSGGTSTTQVFTGQTMSRNGGPQATASTNVVIEGTPAPAEQLFNPVPPIRIADTRDGTGGVGRAPLSPGEVLRVSPRDAAGMPSGDVGGVALNVTAAEPVADGYLTVYPCTDPAPASSNVNYVGGQIAEPNAVIVGVEADTADVCITTSAQTGVIVDLFGWFSDDAGFRPLTPERIADTRDAGIGPVDGPLRPDEVLTVQVSDGPGVVGAAALNVTAANTTAAGYLTVYPCGGQAPYASSVNYEPGQAGSPNAVISGLDDDGQVCITTSAPVDVVVDLTAEFAADAPFVGLTPSRIADTRDGRGGVPIRKLLPGETLEVEVSDDDEVSGAALNVTATEADANGYLTVFPCDGPAPYVSNVNYTTEELASPNAVVTGLSEAGSVCITTYAPVHVVVDLSGLFLR